MIKIYGVPASRTARCLWMLEELGVEYENVPVHFIGEAQKPDFLKINPNGRIPALDDDGVVLWESLAINLYLARKYGEHEFWPSAEADQAQTVQWSIWAMTEVEPPLMEMLMHRAFLPEAQRDEAAAAAGEQALHRPFGVLDQALEGDHYILGSEFQAVDLNVCSVASWATRFGRMDLSNFPNASRWLAACTSRPSLKRAMGQE